MNFSTLIYSYWVLLSHKPCLNYSFWIIYVVKDRPHWGELSREKWELSGEKTELEVVTVGTMTVTIMSYQSHLGDCDSSVTSILITL